MKRIAMISYHTCPLASEEGKESGGMNVYVLELARALAAAGDQVDVFTRSVDAGNMPVVDVAPGLRVVHLIAGPQEMVSKKQVAPYVDEFVHSFEEYCQRNGTRYDLLHCHYYLSGLVGEKINARRERKLPVAMSFHTLALMKNLVARGENEKEDASRIEAEMRLVAEAQAIIATSQSDRKYLHYLYNADEKRISVIAPGVDAKLFRPVSQKDAKAFIGAGEKDKVIVFVGRIEPLKGIDMLLYAMKIVLARNPDMPLCLCIVGGDISQPQSSWSAPLKALEGVRKTLKLTSSVSFVGQKTQHDLVYYYNAAELVVMPSHYESFGMTALEAMSCGVPVITTNVTGVSGLIDAKNAALVTSVNNPLLLADKIEYFLTHPDERIRAGGEVREKVQGLSWIATAKRMSEVYESVNAIV